MIFGLTSIVMDKMKYPTLNQPSLTEKSAAYKHNIYATLRRSVMLVQLFGCPAFIGRPSKHKHTILIVYCLIIAAINFAYFFRNLAFFWHMRSKSDEEFIWALQVLFSQMYATIGYVIECVCNRLYLPKVIIALEKYQATFGFLHDMTKTSKLMKTGYVTLLMSSLLGCLIIPSLHITGQYDSTYMYPLNEQYPRTALIIWYYLHGVATFMVSSTVVAFCMLYTAIAEILTAEFRLIAKEMASVMEQSLSEEIEEGLVKARERHLLISQATAALSQLTRAFVSLNLLFDICYIFFSIYCLGNIRTNDNIVTQCVTITFVLFFIIFIPLVWGRLPVAANLICEVILNTSWQGKSTAVLQKMGLIVSQGSVGKIGIDVFRLFIVDYSTFVMIVSLVATYGLVVLQFRMDTTTTLCPKLSSNFSIRL